MSHYYNRTLIACLTRGDVLLRPEVDAETAEVSEGFVGVKRGRFPNEIDEM